PRRCAGRRLCPRLARPRRFRGQPTGDVRPSFLVALERPPDACPLGLRPPCPRTREGSPHMTQSDDLFTLDPTIRAQLMEASAATVSIQLLKRGFRCAAVQNVRPVNPAATRFVGPAWTLRF